MAFGQTTTGTYKSAKVSRAVRTSLLLLLVALVLTSTASYAQDGKLGPGNEVNVVVEPPPPQPEPELPQITLPVAQPGEQLYIALVAIESAGELAALQQLGYTCNEHAPCEIVGTEAQLSVLRGGGLTLDIIGVVAESTHEDGLEEGSRFGANYTDLDIPVDPMVSSMINITGAPASARITRVKYELLLVDTSIFSGPGDYTLMILPNSMGMAGAFVWVRLGGSTDGGHDDDAVDDDDIFLNGRWINSRFDGEPVNQAFDLAIWLSGNFGRGMLDYWKLWVYYCTASPPAPTLTAPANAAHICDTTPAFDWSSVGGAELYNIWVADNPGFTSPAIATSRAASNYTATTALARKRWYWRVSSHNECGYGPWSGTMTFWIDSFPAVPVLKLPPDGSHTCDTTPTLDWGNAAGATSYDVEVDDDLSFASPAIRTSTRASNYKPSTPLAPDRYYWRVRSRSACGRSAWSRVFSLYVDPKPGLPAGPSPASGATGVPITADLDWADSSRAASYDVYFGTSTTPPRLGTVTVSAFNLPTLAPGTTYYWKIVARNSCGTTSGPLWRFQTAGGANRPPENFNLWPDHGGRAAGRAVNFTATARDPDGWRNLSQVFLHIGSTRANRNNCRMRYDASTNLLYLMNNAGSGWLGGFAPGASRNIRNRQCTLRCAKSTVTPSGRLLRVKFNLVFRTGFRGQKNSYMQSVDMADAVDPWEQMGTWRIQ